MRQGVLPVETELSRIRIWVDLLLAGLDREPARVGAWVARHVLAGKLTRMRDINVEIRRRLSGPHYEARRRRRMNHETSLRSALTEMASEPARLLAEGQIDLWQALAWEPATRALAPVTRSRTTNRRRRTSRGRRS
jgi:hypothetical protein